MGFRVFGLRLTPRNRPQVRIFVSIRSGQLPPKRCLKQYHRQEFVHRIHPIVRSEQLPRWPHLIRLRQPPLGIFVNIRARQVSMERRLNPLALDRIRNTNPSVFYF